MTPQVNVDEKALSSSLRAGSEPDLNNTDPFLKGKVGLVAATKHTFYNGPTLHKSRRRNIEQIAKRFKL